MIGHIALFLRSAIFGAMGGGLFYLLGAPLPWVLGAIAGTVAGSALGFPGYLPRSVRNAIVPALGVTFGCAFDRAAFAYLADLWLLIPLILAYLAVAILGGMAFFSRFGRMNAATAYFSSVPGSFSEMIFAAEQAGADLRIVAVVHTMRQVVGLTIITLAFRYWLGIDTSGIPQPAGGPMTSTGAILLVACGVLGAFGGKAMRLPSAFLFGPMLVSAAAHLSGVVEVAPPTWVAWLVQIAIGVFIGLRLEGLTVSNVVPLIGLSVVWVLVLLSVAAIAAEIAVLILGLPHQAAFLAFAPGGAVEISIVALAAGVSLSIVTLIQIIRITLTIVLVPLAFRLLGFGRI